jgi:hypothetical protein
LSQKDIDFPDRYSVDEYFKIKLPSRDPSGLFFLKNGFVASDGIAIGENIVFSYKTEIMYVAKAASGRHETLTEDRLIYPYYFIVDMGTVVSAKGYLSDLQTALGEIGIEKNIAKQGWPRIPDSVETESIWESLKHKRA